MPTDPLDLSSIVLLAHGPASDTLTAARRLEGIVAELEDIVVIEATPPGATAVDRAVDRGYATASRDELVSVVRGASGPLLVLHDDVVVDFEAINAMLRTHMATGLVAVPGTEDDHGAVDFVCAVGSPAQLADLADRAAFGPGMVVEESVARTPDADITHRQSCQTRRSNPRDVGRPLLVAGLIVRNEEDHLEACLASLDGVVDRIEVVDTGSIDATIEIARRAGANVTEIDWRNDFAWARNHTLGQCADAAYMIWIDADERFCCEDPSAFREMLATYHRIYPSYSMQLHNLTAEGTETHSFVARRITNPSLVSFRGALHEQVERTDGRDLVTAYVTNASIRHLGYDTNVVDLGRKMERNLAIARSGFDEEPSEANAVHLARALKGASTDPEATIRELAPLRAELTDSSPVIQALLHGLEAELFLAAEQLDNAAAAATRTLDLVPEDAIAGAVLAEALTRLNRLPDVVETAADYSQRHSPTPLVIDRLAEQTRARIVFEAAIRIGDPSAASDYVSDLPPELDAWPILAEHLELDDLVDLAERASQTNDEGYVRVVTSNGALDLAQLDHVATAFASTSSAVIGLLIETARNELVGREEHIDLRTAFDMTEGIDEAIAYARCLVSGHVDLSIELDDVPSRSEPTSAALALAAEAHFRRGDQSSAIRDAEASIQRSAGSTRAATIVAASALEQGDPRRALDLVEASRSGQNEPITRNRRHELAALASQAHLELGDLAAAVSEAVEVVEDDGSLAHWPALLERSQQDSESLALVIGLALLGDEVAFIDAVARAVAPARTAEVCGTYLALGGTNPDAVSTGLLAAVLVGQTALALVIADHAHLLPNEIRARLAAHFASEGASEIALQIIAEETHQAA